MALTTLAGIVVVFIGYRSVHNLKLQMTDADLRELRARAVLRFAEMPPGWHAGVGRSVFPLVEAAVLFDRPLDDGLTSERTERMFLYIHWPWGSPDPQGYLDGTEDAGRLVAEHGFHLERGTPIRDGRLAVGPAEVTWTAHRGTMSTGDGRRLTGVTTMMLVECPDDDRLRLGFWVGPDPHPALGVAEASFEGTPADPERIRGLLAGFDLCG